MNKYIILIGLNILLWGMFKPLLFAQVYSDTTWERLYYHENEDENTFSFNHIETYDKGYLLATYLNQDGAYKPKIFKTDINGYYLWDRMLDTTLFVGILAMTEDIDGSVYICGSTFPAEYPNPLVMKINVCGEVEWCKTFIWSNGSDAKDIEIDQNGDIILLTSDYGNLPSERINLIKLTRDGELIWKKNYATIENHPWIWNAQGNQLIISNKNDYYITGQAWWPTNNDPGQGSGLRPFFVKATEDGYEEWVLPFGTYDQLYGYASRSYQVNDTLFLSVSYNLSGPVIDQTQTILVWYGSNGEIYQYNTQPLLEDEYYNVSIFDAQMISNNILWGIMFYNLTENEEESHVGYIKIDTAFNVLDYMIDGSWYPNSRMSLFTSFNDRFISVAAMKEDASGNVFDVYISKRNEDYSFDSVYTAWPGSYDTLCPHAIQSGYLDYECETIIVGTNEVEQKPNQELQIKITPNPAKKKVNISFENHSYKELNIQIYNINGEEMLSSQLHSYPQSSEINVSNLAKGVYLVTVSHKSMIVGREKMVVE